MPFALCKAWFEVDAGARSLVRDAVNWVVSSSRLDGGARSRLRIERARGAQRPISHAWRSTMTFTSRPRLGRRRRGEGVLDHPEHLRARSLPDRSQPPDPVFPSRSIQRSFDAVRLPRDCHRTQLRHTDGAERKVMGRARDSMVIYRECRATPDRSTSSVTWAGRRSGTGRTSSPFPARRA